MVRIFHFFSRLFLQNYTACRKDHQQNIDSDGSHHKAKRRTVVVSFQGKRPTWAEPGCFLARTYSGEKRVSEKRSRAPGSTKKENRQSHVSH